MKKTKSKFIGFEFHPTAESLQSYQPKRLTKKELAARRKHLAKESKVLGIPMTLDEFGQVHCQVHCGVAKGNLPGSLLAG